jgi:hypothetical protein
MGGIEWPNEIRVPDAGRRFGPVRPQPDRPLKFLP